MYDHKNLQFIDFMSSSTESTAIDEFLKSLNQQFIYDSILKKSLYEDQTLSDYAIIRKILADNFSIENKRRELAKELCKTQNQLNNFKNKLPFNNNLEILEGLVLDELLVFLPAIFKNFWNTVSPKEFAYTIELKTIPIITTPYITPTRSRVRTIKRRFENLRPSKRQKILFLCQLLRKKHNLVIHRDFLRLIDTEG